MLQSYINTNVLEYCNDSYQNSWFLVKKKSEKYQIINAVINMNWYIVWDTNFLSNIKKFIERSAEMTVVSLVNFYSEYNQVELHWKSCDMIVFQTSLELLWQTELSMRATNSVDQFWQIVCWMLEENCDDDKMYFDDIQINELKMKYNNEKILLL